MSVEERMAQLEARVARAEARIAQLEPRRNGEVPTPAIPYGPGGWPTWPLYPAPEVVACGKCGLKMDGGVMGYVCPNGGNCPTGLGGFSCGVTDALSRNNVSVTVSNTANTRPNPANGAPKPPGYNPVA